MPKSITIRPLCCGSMRVSPSVLYGNDVNLRHSAHQLFARDEKRVVLPVYAFLVEHPQGRFLIDTGFPREMSPKGEYDPKAVSALLPRHLAQFYRPWVPQGMAITEQLESLGLKPSDLDCVILTHFDPDHIGGLKSLKGAKRVIVAEDEYFWTCRTVYRARQPKHFYDGVAMEHYWFKGSDVGPNRWAYDVLGDGTLITVSVPGHTDGMVSVLVTNGELLEHKHRFVLLTSDAAFTPRNWQEMITPGFGFDPKLQRRGLEWIASQEKREGCIKVLTSHDPDLDPQPITIDLAE